jgi:hypothetical protein
MKPFAYYSNLGMSHPKAPQKPILDSKKSTDEEEVERHLERVKQFNKDVAEYRRLEEQYRRREHELYSEFKHDLLEEFKLTNHPKADRIYEYCWDKGHSYGFEEVYNAMSDLSDLFI